MVHTFATVKVISTQSIEHLSFSSSYKKYIRHRHSIVIPLLNEDFAYKGQSNGTKIEQIAVLCSRLSIPLLCRLCASIAGEVYNYFLSARPRVTTFVYICV